MSVERKPRSTRATVRMTELELRAALEGDFQRRIKTIARIEFLVSASGFDGDEWDLRRWAVALTDGEVDR